MDNQTQKALDDLRQEFQDKLDALTGNHSINDVPSAIIKPWHLVAGANPEGSLYTSDGTNFSILNPGATGSVLVLSNGLPAYLSPGTSGQVLTISGGLPVYATPATAGYVWASWVPTWTGFSVAPTVSIARYITIGKIVYFQLYCSGNGTSNTTRLEISMPVAIGQTFIGGVVGYGVDNGAILTTALGAVYNASGSLQLSPTLAQVFTGWTNSGAKSANIQGFYEVA
jgi:hypothetical protein